MHHSSNILGALSSSLGSTRVVWAGEIDCDSVRPLAASLQAAEELETIVVEVDLSGVTFIDCAGVTPLLQAHTRLQDQLRLVAPSRPVTRLLDLLGLTNLVTVVRPVAAASERHLVSLMVRDTPDRRMDGPVLGIPRELSDRATIDQAKGLLMGIHGCDAASAWDLLSRAARTHGVRIHEIARTLLDDASGGPERLDGLGGLATGDRISGGFAWDGLARDQLTPEAQVVVDDVLAELRRCGPTIDPTRNPSDWRPAHPR